MKYFLPLLLIAGSYGFSEGVAAYREGRFQESLKAFSEAESAAGHGASAELLYNKALAALGAGNLLEAETAAETAAARGGEEFRALRDFLLGNAAFARCERAEKEADKSNAKVSALDEAIRHAGRAARFWQQAAASRADWPEARRNAERALRKLDDLEKRKEEKRLQKQKEEEKKKEALPPPLQPENPGSDQKVRKAAPLAEELPTDMVLHLLEKLEEKEEAKRDLRGRMKVKRKTAVEKEW